MMHLGFFFVRRAVIGMIDEAKLDEYRLKGELVRVVRDANPANDVVGYIVAWSEDSVMIRKRNRKIVKLERAYRFEPAQVERSNTVDE